MKKLLPIMIVLVLLISGFGAGAATFDDQTALAISDTIAFSQPEITEKNEYVRIEIAESTFKSMGEGKPELPIVTKRYFFPFGTEINDVTVVFSQEYQLSLSKKIIPAQKTTYISTDFSNKEAMDHYIQKNMSEKF